MQTEFELGLPGSFSVIITMMPPTLHISNMESPW